MAMAIEGSGRAKAERCTRSPNAGPAPWSWRPRSRSAWPPRVVVWGGRVGGVGRGGIEPRVAVAGVEGSSACREGAAESGMAATRPAAPSQ